MIGPSKNNMELTLYSRLGPVTWDPSWIFRVIQIMFSYLLIKAPDLFGHFMTKNSRGHWDTWGFPVWEDDEVFSFQAFQIVQKIQENNQHRSRAVLPVSVSGTQPTQLNPILRPLQSLFFFREKGAYYKALNRSNGGKEFYHLVNCWRFWVVAIFDEWYISFT